MGKVVQQHTQMRNEIISQVSLFSPYKLEVKKQLPLHSLKKDFKVYKPKPI